MNTTQKQQELLDYLEHVFEVNEKLPSLREIGEALGCSHTNVAVHLKELERKGIIKREGRYSRNITLYPNEEEQRGSTVRNIPVIGQVTAGLPMYAQQEYDGTVAVDAKLFCGTNLFGLRIKGQSMKDAGIFDGDLVICEPRQYASDGEIVVALIENEEATVKYFRKHNNCIELVPANDAFTPVRYKFSEIMVQGKVKGVIRDRILDQ